MGVGAGTPGYAEAGVVIVDVPIELDLVIGGATGDCSGVGRGRRRGLKRAVDMV